ncbi:hypothetical protein [Streptomyces sp. NPDC005953]|uniref:hypothetical protein n=1 Tax=Streptomyces sp. NPDC005953 TaxID=3156719 RepID=UPI00340AE3E7
MTDEQLLAVPGIGETSLARIRRAFPAPEPPSRSVSVEEVVRLEGALHLLRFALDRFAAAKFAPAPEYLRDLLDRATADPGEPCDREQQYTRAEAAEATIDRVREASAHIRATTRTWEPVADLIDAALDDAKRPRERRERPAHPDGTPYRYHEITAGGWGHCDGCRTWTTATTERPHECPKTYMKGPAAEEGRHEP